MLKNTPTALFNDLAMLTEAGIPIKDAARKVSASSPDDPAWAGVIRRLEQGCTLSAAFGKSGLISRYEQEIISIAEFSGRVSEGLRSIARSHDTRRKRVGRLKSRLHYSFAVLLIAIGVSAITNLVKDPDASIIMVTGEALLWIVLATVVTRFLLRLLQKDACFWLKQTRQFESRDWYRKHFQQVIFTVLLWHIKSGIDFKTGFLKISGLIDVPAIRNKLVQASHYCGQGTAVTESSTRAGLPLTREFRQISHSGEHSGRWEDAVQQHLEQQAILLGIQLDTIFEWIPRMYYGVIILVVFF